MSLVDPFEELNGKIGVVARSHSELRERFDELEQLVNAHENALADMKKTQKMLGELLEIFISVKGGLQFIGWFATIVKWTVGILVSLIPLILWLATGKWGS